MSDFESYERRIREEAERKITAGRGLHEAAAAVLATHELYRGAVDEARAAGWDEAELSRFGLLVDGVRVSTKPKNAKSPVAKKAAPKSSTAGASATAKAPSARDATGAAAESGPASQSAAAAEGAVPTPVA
ncbi:hypothetical protein ACFWPX_30025 [Nocardia sp. NPDC058518]|uniref:hypothetical protein n=1 Tax=Nocardia sp. NPDC058518 TaxID=3346534 RepID=UPI003654A644